MASLVDRAKRRPLVTLLVVETVFFASTTTFIAYGNLAVPSWSQLSFRLIATVFMTVFALALIVWFGWNHETGIDTLGGHWRLVVPVFLIVLLPWGAGFELESYQISNTVTLTGVSAAAFVLVAYLLTGVGGRPADLRVLHWGFVHQRRCCGVFVTAIGRGPTHPLSIRRARALGLSDLVSLSPAATEQISIIEFHPTRQYGGLPFRYHRFIASIGRTTSAALHQPL